jgi:hypothetical protein
MLDRLAALALVCLLAGPAGADPFVITDSEGFGAAMPALTIDLPPGWAATGRIAWNKPCSANELFEIVLNARSADGQAGLRITPGHSVQWIGASADRSVDPMIAQMALAQAESARNQMQTAFRDSNCHVGQVADTAAILNALVLPKRPQGARVTRIAPDETRLAGYRAAFGQQMAGLITRFDAAVVDLVWPGPGGGVAERLWLSWYQFADDPRATYIAGLPGNHYQATTIETLAFAWAPGHRAAEIDAAERALKTMRADPAWQARVQEVQKKLADERARARQQSEADRKLQQARRDADHRRFLETIRQ